MKTNQTTLLRLILPMVFLVFGMTSVKSQTSVTNPDTVCRNTIEIYRVDSTAGSSYAWSIKNGTGAILNTPVNGRSFIRIQWDNTVGSDSVFVVETNNFGCVGSANKLRVERYSEPVPTLSIPSATVCQNGSFTVTASPNGIPVGLSYQWYFGTNPIPGATLPTFSKLNLQPSDAGSYKCLVTNACGFNYSPDFTLNVVVPPAITLQPIKVSTCLAGTATLTAAASGTGPLTYQWYKGLPPTGTPVTDAPGHISGSTTPVLSFSNMVYSDTARYYLVVTGPNGCTPAQTNTVKISMNIAPVITVNISDKNLCPGANTSFSITATGDSLKYKWYFGSTAATTLIPGETFSTLSLSNITYANEGYYKCEVYNTCGTVNSFEAHLNMDSPIVITTQPNALDLCAGNSATFTVTATGEAISYQWLRGSTNPPTNTVGTNSATYTIPSLVYADEMNYQVVLANTCYTVPSNVVALNMNTLPSIVTHPVGTSACAGQSVTFNALGGGEAIHYEWRKAGVGIAGTDATSYTLNNITYGDEALYSVRVYNNCNSSGVISNDALLNMPTVATITSNPTSLDLCQGSSATFTATASGEELVYQWYFGTAPTGILIPGANANSYTIASLTYGNEGNYYVTVSNLCSSVTSTAATLNMNSVAAITAHPMNLDLCPGNNAAFSVTATGEALNYEWHQTSDNAIVGGNSPTLNLLNITFADEDGYYCRVYNNCSSVNSTTAQLNMNTFVAITGQPVTISKCVGETATFSVTATGEAVTYDWRRDGFSIGVNTATLTLTNITYADEGTYTCYVSNNCSNVLSAGAQLIMNTPPTITSHPVKLSKCVGDNGIEFKVVASGEALVYEWRFNGNPISTAMNPTAATPTLVLNNITYANEGDYTCYVYNNCNNTLSNPARLNMNEPPVITVQPKKISTCLGAIATISVQATGDSLTYQWYRNGSIVPGAIASSYTLNPVTLGNIGKYKVVITNNCNVTTSLERDITVNIVPVVTNQPDSVSTCLGSNTSFTFTATGDSLHYQWYKNGALIPGQTATTLSFSPVTYADTANYYCRIWNTCAPVNTVNANLNINIVPVITVQPQNLLSCVGNNDVLAVTATGDSLYYQWNFNGFPIPGATNRQHFFTPVTLANIGNYSVTIHNTCSTITSNTVNLFANISPDVVEDPDSVSTCLGRTARFVTRINAVGSALPNFQWYRNGNILPGKTDSVLIVSPVSLANIGNYTCRLFNNCDDIMTEPALLSVNIAPVKVQEPLPISTCPGNVNKFEVIATGDSLFYQWYKNSNLIPGATASTLNFNPVGPGDIANYYVSIWNTCGNAVSNTVAVTMNIPPVLNNDITGGNFCDVQNLVLNMNATGDSVKYIWYKDNSPIPGETSSTLSFIPLDVADNGVYQGRAWNNCGYDLTSLADIYVNNRPRITLQPVGLSSCAGAEVTLVVEAQGDSIEYQWRLEGIDIPGANSNSLTISNIQYSQTGNYVCQLRNSCGVTYTNPAKVTINRVPVIVQNPASQIRCETDLMVLSTQVTGDSLFYQWSLNNNPIPGATSSTYTVNSVSTADAGDYRCYIYNTCGNATTAVATVTVYRLPVVTSNPVSRTRCENDSVTFRIHATGDLLSYQWYHNTVAIAGATSNVLSIPTVSVGNQGDYYCELSSQHCGFVNSTLATLTVIPSIQVEALTTNISCNGSNDGAITLSVLNGSTPYTFAWSNGATSQNLTGLGEGLYTVTIRDGNNCRNSATIGIGQPETFGFYNDTTTWNTVNQMGSLGQDIVYASATDKDGNYYVTGSFSSTAIFGAVSLTSFGDEDVFVAKYDVSGSLLWVRQAGGTLKDRGQGISVDSTGSVYVSGLFTNLAFFDSQMMTASGNQDAFIAKYSSNGSLNWVKAQGGFFDDQAIGIQSDERGNSYVTGSFQGIATFNGIPLVSRGGDDIWVAKYNNLGEVQWVHQAGGTSEETGHSIALDVSRNVIIGGLFQGAATFGSSTVLNSAGSTDGFVAKYNTLGEFKWATKMGGAQADAVYAVKSDYSGNVFMAGMARNNATLGVLPIASNGEKDIIVAKLTKSGSPMWVKAIGGTGNDAAKSIAVDANANVYVGGSFRNSLTLGRKTITSNGVNDIFVASFNTNGFLNWWQHAGGIASDSCMTISLLPNNDLIVGGSFGDSAAFGGNVLSLEGESDGYIYRLNQEHIYTAPEITMVNCFGGTEGAINLTVGGGTRPYSFDWSNEATTEDLANLPVATYWLFMDDAHSCEFDTSIRIDFQFQQPVAPATVSVNRNYLCFDDPGKITLSAAGGSGDTLVWYSGSCGGLRIGVGNNLQIDSPTDTTTYYARWENACGGSACKSIDVIILPAPVAPVATSVTPSVVCQGLDYVVLTATGGQGEVLKWYDDIAAITPIGTGSPFTYAAPATTSTYYARWESACGNSALVPVTITVNPLAVKPTSITSSANDICTNYNTPITLTAVGGSGDILKWTEGSCNGSVINNVNPLLINAPTTTTTYYAYWENGCGKSECDSITIRVIGNPPAPLSIAPDVNNYCAGTEEFLTLTATGGNGTLLKWYTGYCNGTLIGTSTTNSITIPAPLATTVYYASWENACGISPCANVTVTVYPVAPVSILNLQPSYCNNEPRVLIEGSLKPLGKFYGNAGITNLGNGTAWFNPAALTPGTYPVIYNYKSGNGCISADTVNVTINPVPIVTILSLQNQYCINALPATISGTPFPFGTFFGPVTNNNDGTAIFDPAVAGLGTHTITYTATQNGCTNSTSKEVTVVNLPTVDFTGLMASYCEGATPVPLTGNHQPDGYFQNDPGVTNIGLGMAIFDPAGVTVGAISNVTYIYTDPATGCENSKTKQVVVNAKPVITFTGLQPTYCLNDATSTLNGSMLGEGWFTEVPGVIDNHNGTATFNPAIAGVGTHTVTYHYTNPDNCSDEYTMSTVVYPLPTVSFTGLSATYCANSATATLQGNKAPFGQFTSTTPGLVDNGNGTATFNPVVSGPGTFVITYSYQDNTTACTNTQSKTVVVNALPVLSISNLNPDYCISDNFTIIEGNIPFEGHFSGNGITDLNNGKAKFSPSVAGLGTHDILYFYTNSNGCSDTVIAQTVVNPAPIFTISNLASAYCANESADTIQGSEFPLGSFSITPSTPGFVDLGIGKAIFNPSNTAPGEYNITYTYNSVTPGDCSGDTTYTVIVNPVPDATFTGLLPEFCEDANPVVLIGNQIPNGTFSGVNGPLLGLEDSGLGYAIFTPSVAGPGGPYAIKFTYTSPEGCSDSMIQVTTVNPLPVKPTSITATPTSYCVNTVNLINFKANGGSGTVKWYKNSAGGTLVGIGSNVDLPAPSDTTWYFARTENDCGVSEADSVRIDVLYLPQAPIDVFASQNDFCAGTVSSLVLTSTGGNGSDLKWYTGSCGGTYIGSGETFTVPTVPTTTTTYYARWENICGISLCKSITVRVYPQPVAADSISVDQNNFCSGTYPSITLKTWGGSGDKFEWYRNSCGDTLIGSGTGTNPTLQIPAPTVTTTYFGRWMNGCDTTFCQSVTVTVIPLPIAPDSITSSDNQFCSGSVSTITLQSYGGGNGTVTWYEGGCGNGTSIGTGASLLLNAPLVTTYYYARYESECGASICKSIKINVFDQPIAPDSLTVDTTHFCVSYNGIIKLRAHGGIGDSVSWYKDGCGTTYLGSGVEYRMIAPDTTTTFYARWESSCGNSVCDTLTVYVDQIINLDTVYTDRPVVCYDDPGVIRLYAEGAPEGLITWYANSCGGDSIGTGNSLILPSPEETTVYYAQWSNHCGVSACDTVRVTVKPLTIAPTAIVVDTNNYCPGSVATITLSAVGGLGDTVEWFIGSCNGIKIGNVNPFTIPAPVANITYYARWKNDCSVSECASIDIIMNLPEPVTFVGVDTNNFCPGTVTAINLYTHGGKGDVLKWYTKDDAGALVNIGQGQPLNLFAPDTTTWYYVNWVNVCGESTIDSVRVKVNEPVVPASLVADVTVICSDYPNQIQLGAIGGNGDSLQWFTGGCGAIKLGVGNPFYVDAPKTTTTYYARYTNACGITECNSITINVVQQPVIFAGGVDSVCEGSHFNTVRAYAIETSSLNWTTTGTGTFSNPSSIYTTYYLGPEDVVERDTVYLILTAQGNTPCGAYVDTLVLYVNPLPVLSVTVPDAYICSGQTVTIAASGAESYVWTPGTGLDTIGGPVVIASPTVTTTYQLIGTSASGCIDTLDVQVNVLTHPYVDLGKDLYLFTCEPVMLDAGESDGIERYEWNDGSNRRLLRVEESGFYSVTVSNDACSMSDTVYVQLCGGYLHMPTAFSPNNDGINEVFNATSTDPTITFHMYIFNRTGMLVYETDSLFDGWDGKDSNGKYCESGVYVWKIVYRGDGTVSPGVEQTQTGTVMLMR